MQKKLEGIIKARENLKLDIETYFVDIIAWDELEKIVKKSDIIFTCLDNLEARLEINLWAVKYKKPLIDGGTSLNGLRGRVITVIPYKTPCLGCYFDVETMYEAENEQTLIACGASLPTTMAIVAALQVDRGIKVLLGMEKSVIPRIFINLEEEVNVVPDYNVKRRKNCRFCGYGGAKK